MQSSNSDSSQKYELLCFTQQMNQWFLHNTAANEERKASRERIAKALQVTETFLSNATTSLNSVQWASIIRSLRTCFYDYSFDANAAWQRHASNVSLDTRHYLFII